MSKLMLNLIGDKRAVHRYVDSSLVDALIASLSAEPDTFDDLRVALTRFRASGFGDSPPATWNGGVCEEPEGTGICLIDLRAKLVVCDSSHASPSARGFVEYHGGQGPAVQLWFRLSDEWLLWGSMDDWRQLSDSRSGQRETTNPAQTRDVLYQDLLGFLVEECIVQAGSANVDPQVAECAEDLSTVIASIHRSWLLSCQPRLNNRTPRDVLLEKHEVIESDLQSRRDQWSLLDECPPGLNQESNAFRQAGFGTHEIVLYYDMVRHLLSECWGRVASNPKIDKLAEIARLQHEQELWLTTSTEGVLEGYSPEAVITAERRRIPLAISGEAAMIDCDCPLCQMMAESGPVFLHLDGCHMDEDFAFSFHQSEKEWEAERAEWESLARQWKEEEQNGEKDGSATRPPSLWQRSRWESDLADSDGIGPEFLLIAIAACLAELGLDLKISQESAPMVAVLNNHFGNLRDVVRDPSSELLRPVVDRLTDELQQVVDCRPDLTLKCNDLQERLAAFASRITDVRKMWR